MKAGAMAVQVKDIVLEKVATGPVSARVYQGAEWAKGRRSFCSSTAGPSCESGVKESAVAESMAKAGAIVAIPDYNAPLGNVFPKAIEVGYSVFSYLANKRAPASAIETRCFLSLAKRQAAILPRV